MIRVQPAKLGGGFFFNDTATTEIYALSLHDALPILVVQLDADASVETPDWIQKLVAFFTSDERIGLVTAKVVTDSDRKSTRLNSSHANISYADFCLKKKPTLQCFITHP